MKRNLPLTVLILLFTPLMVLAKHQDILRHYIDHFKPPWLKERLERDFEPLRNKKITKKTLNDFCNLIDSSNEYVRVQIKNNHVKLLPLKKCSSLEKTADRVRRFLSSLRKISKIRDLPDLDFIMYFGDGIHQSKPLPIFCFAKDKRCENLISIPDHEALCGLGNFYREVKKHDVPYFEKKPKAFWRGATTGGDFTSSNWKNFPRSKLTLFSLKNPNLCDAKFAFVASNNKAELEKTLIQEQVLDQFVKIKDHLPYKFLVDIDGNSCTYSRLHWILFSNSLCLKQNSHLEQWYYTGLKPYVHYLPFHSDMSNFKDVINWALSHETECEQIVKNAKVFVRNNLTHYPALAYFYRVLLEYAKHQDF